MNRLDVDEVMTQVRAEITRRRTDSPPPGSVAPPGAEAVGLWSGALPVLPARSEYILDELLAYSDHAFVQSAYLAVLRRPPDAEGQRFYLQHLRSGNMGKVEVLAALRWSDEGRAKGVHVDGLLLPYLLQKWKRLPLLGPLLAWVHGLLRLGSIIGTRMARLEATQAHELHELGRHFNRTFQQLDERQATSGALVRQKLETLSSQGTVATQAIDSVLFQIADLEARITADSIQVRELVGQMNSLEVQIRGIEQCYEHKISGIDESINELRTALESHVAELDDRARMIKNDLASARGELAGHGELLGRAQQRRNAKEQFRRALDPFYVAFEQRFRGAPEIIRTRALPYLDILREAEVGGPDKPVLDLGCGNGEWLDVLRENGLYARGVDTNRVFIDLCRGRGLDVVEADALAYLRGLPDGALGAITGMHIAEHLPFEMLVALIDECRRVLCLGGVVALETPNPENLQVGAHYFYMDPTHRNPLPPESLRWILEARGFKHCRIERWTLERELDAPALLSDDLPGAESVNAMLAHFHVAPDYAVIGRRL